MLNISPQAVSDWGEKIPELRRRQLYDAMEEKKSKVKAA